MLTFPHADQTWVYDITTGLWHEWAWIDTNGAEHRHRANCFWPCNDTLVVGDWQNGNLYALDQDVFTDNGQPIKRVRSFPHMLADGKRVFYRQFLADMETGWAPEVMSGSDTRLRAQFTAPNGTNLSTYISEVGGGWTAVGPANAQIVGDKVVGIGGDALYQSAAAILTPDYTLHFDVVPPVAGSVVSGNTVWAIGRATGANTGYRVGSERGRHAIHPDARCAALRRLGKRRHGHHRQRLLHRLAAAAGHQHHRPGAAQHRWHVAAHGRHLAHRSWHHRRAVHRCDLRRTPARS